MQNVKVENMRSTNSNREVANQYIITMYDNEGNLHEYFQSYQSVIAHKTYGVNPSIVLDAHYWDYSTTTGKYRNAFLGEDKKTTEKKIKDGIYQLADLNA